VRFAAAGQYKAALEDINDALQAEPNNPNAFAIRGTIYAAQKLWQPAEEDYERALRANSGNAQVRFNLAQLAFSQKQYAVARARFAVLQNDLIYGDLAMYKLFLCDLLTGREDTAAKELAAFDEVGSHASYYFANAAWSLFHQKNEDAQGWLTSASHIYAPQKYKIYLDALSSIGNPPTPGKIPSPGINPPILSAH
jgi:Tfp pilus assembly protein PilF